MEPVQLITGPVAKAATIPPCWGAFWHSPAWPNFRPFAFSLSCIDYQKRTEIYFFFTIWKKMVGVKERIQGGVCVIVYCFTVWKSLWSFFIGRVIQIQAGLRTLQLFSLVTCLNLSVNSHVYWSISGLAVFLWTGVKVINFMNPNWSWWPRSAWKVARKAMRKMYNENGKTLQASCGCGMRLSKWEEAGKVMPVYIFH